MAKSFSHNYQFSRGYTFIELLISLALSAILVTSTITLFFVVKKAYFHQEGLSILQENARAFSSILEQAITQSGNMGCNHLHDVTLTLHGINEEKCGLQHKQGIFAISPSDLKHNLPDSLLQKRRLDSDMLWINSTSGEYFLLSSFNENNGKFSVRGKVSISKGDMIALSDCGHVDLFKVWAEPEYLKSKSSTEMTIHPSGENVTLGKQYDRNARIGLFSSAFYYIGLTSRTNAKQQPIYALYRKGVGERTQELVEGVEFLKIRFGVKLGNNIVYRTANQIEPHDKIRSVRIAALFCTVEDVLDKAQPYVLNGQEITPTDGKMRAWFNYEWKV